MPAPEPANLFGFSVETWVWLIISVIATFIMVVAAKQKRRRRAELGDDEEAVPYDEAAAKNIRELPPDILPR